MPTAYLDTLRTKRDAAVEAANAILDAAAADGRELTEDERTQVTDYHEAAKRYEADHAALVERENEASKFAAATAVPRARVEAHDRALDRRESERNDDGTEPERPDTRSVGRKFVESEAFLNYKGRGTSEAVEFADFLGLDKRAAITTDDLNILPYQYTGRIGYVESTPLLDVIGREVVNSGSVTYMDWGTEDPVAGGPIAEGDLKPEATITPTEVPLALATYAHWKAITRQALDDYPRIQSIVEGKLRGGVAARLEQGAAAALTGATLETVTNADLLTAIRVAIGDVQSRGFTPNAVALNPADFAALDVTAAQESNSGPTAFGNFWGLRPVAVGAIPAGEAYVGDLRQGVTWFDRNVTSVFMTDSHADYFVRNLLVILAEARAAFAVTDAGALAKVTTGAEALTASTAKTASK